MGRRHGVLEELGSGTDLGEPSIQGRVEEAVLDLLGYRLGSDGLEYAAAG